MKITEVRIFPTESKDGKLKAFATMTFDDWFVIRNVKVIQGNNGLFVAMPSRKAMDACPRCDFKNAAGSKYCNQCGSQLPQKPIGPVDDEREKHGGHMDIAHPITQECRVYIQEKILEAFYRESGDKQPQARIVDTFAVDKKRESSKKNEQETETAGIEETNDIKL